MLTAEPKEALLDSEVTWSNDGGSNSFTDTGVATVLTAEVPAMVKNPQKYAGRQRVNQLGTTKKATKGRVVISFEDGLPKSLDRHGFRGDEQDQ